MCWVCSRAPTRIAEVLGKHRRMEDRRNFHSILCLEQPIEQLTNGFLSGDLDIKKSITCDEEGGWARWPRSGTL
jgi:hypothetical protein